MNTCSEKIVHCMHAYLDGDISHDDEQLLKQHLEHCESCRELMADLTDAVEFIGQAELIEAPEGFVNNVMQQLPKAKPKASVHRWLRRHPFLAAVAMFFILMSASVFSSYGNDQQFSVTQQPNLVVEGDTVVVPEGEVVKGDIVVKNGDLRIEGEVDGNVTVIGGSKYMASTAVITGTSEEIDRAFDWLWYKMKETVKTVLKPFEKEEPVSE